MSQIGWLKRRGKEVFMLSPLCFRSLKDPENASLAPAMNGVMVHSKLVDHFEELLIQQSDLSFLW